MKFVVKTLTLFSVGCVLAGITSSASATNKGHHPTARYQTANVWAPPSPETRIGAAWLIREKQRIRGRIMSKVPNSGFPQTLWIVVFNNPAACASSPCADTDIANPAVKASVFNGSGAISASDGNGGHGVFNVDFELLDKPLPKGLFLLVGDPKGLYPWRGYRAEVHLIIDEHPLPGLGESWIPDLTTTHFPGAGPNTTVAVAIFLGCRNRSKSCPESVF